MAFVTCKLKSAVLQTQVDVRLYFPCDLPREVGYEVKGVLTLLHGFSNAAEDWIQYSAASRYAADNGLVLIIPSCSNSFYNDMAYGGAYYTFITMEMPVILSRIFNIPQNREINFIAGLSMGGYGALRIGLANSDKYAACASFSGAVDVQMMLAEKERPEVKYVFAPIFGDNLDLPQESNLFYLADNVSNFTHKNKPRILCTCGRQDYEPYMIRPQNQAFSQHLSKLDLDYKYLEWDGVHEWSFWDKSLVIAIDFFLNNGYAVKKLKDWSEPIEEICP